MLISSPFPHFSGSQCWLHIRTTGRTLKMQGPPLSTISWYTFESETQGVKSQPVLLCFLFCFNLYRWFRCIIRFEKWLPYYQTTQTKGCSLEHHDFILYINYFFYLEHCSLYIPFFCKTATCSRPSKLKYNLPWSPILSPSTVNNFL